MQITSVKVPEANTESIFGPNNIDTLVIGVKNGSEIMDSGFKDLDGKLSGKLSKLTKSYLESSNFLPFTKDKILNIPVSKENDLGGLKHIVLVGLGDPKANEDQSKVLASVMDQLKKNETQGFSTSGFNQEMVTEMSILRPYQFEKITNKKQEEDKKPKKLAKLIHLHTWDEQSKELQAHEKSINIKEVIANATNYARDLVMMPPNKATPKYIEDEALKLKDSTNMTVEVYSSYECKNDLKAGGLNAVGQGATNPDEAPRMIVLTYKPPKWKQGDQHLGIVGKTITHDNGGVNIKTDAKSLLKMKSDMAGGASALAAMKAIQELAPENIAVTVVLPATTNCLDGKSFKPGDVITMMDGTTVENINSDAEGRLTMADALAYLQSEFNLKVNPARKPTHLIDIATLTGGSIIGTGNLVTPAMTNNKEFYNDYAQKGQGLGEKLQLLELFKEYADRLKSKVADIASHASPSAQIAAMFLQNFVKDNLPWIHFDIAGPSWKDRDEGGAMNWAPASGPTGVGTRRLVNYVLKKSQEHSQDEQTESKKAG